MNSSLLLRTGALCLALSASSASAALTVLHSWSMGDEENGVPGQPVAATLVDTVGNLDLSLTGAPAYETLGGGTGVKFNNQNSAHNVLATEYYSGTGDVGVTNTAQWGIEAIVRIDVIPALNQELSVLEIGGGQDGILLETFGNGSWAIHRSNVAITNDASPVATGQTQHLAAVRDAAGWQLWVDGVQVTSFGTAAYDPAPGIRLGAGSVGSGDFRGFNGVISEARVFEYTGAFNINETLYAVPEPSTTSGLMLAAGCLLMGRGRRSLASRNPERAGGMEG
ncbi:MAG: PEP-CTERM sorting domain-containing protein [Verrucomicrobiaceae bacterium]|nr:MAG: PEP-CTERM sorting domain-containing protein [Verrucomicrobiaceae bacterium]